MKYYLIEEQRQLNKPKEHIRPIIWDNYVSNVYKRE